MSHPTVLILGLGFMGSSLAAALSRSRWPVLLHHRRSEVSAAAQRRGFGEQVLDPVAAMARADLAVVCAPVGVIAQTVRTLAQTPAGTVITDIGSAKGTICAALEDLGHAGRFVGAHPMAGSHQQGLEHAQDTLYQGCVTAITPVPGTPEASIARVEQLWHAVGSRTLRLTPQQHDAAVAEASHVPHVLAAIAAAGLGSDALPLASSGFRDTTRVAAGSPQLWCDILLQNRDAVLTALEAADERVTLLTKALHAGDASALTAWLEAGCAGRRRYDQHQAELGPLAGG
jgi:prephenate dehydrogenase